MVVEIAGKILDAVLSAVPSFAASAVPEHWRKRALARWEDLSPFGAISANHDLIRAARLAWIEAAFAVLDATERASRWPNNVGSREAMNKVLGLARDELRGVRAAAFDRRIVPARTAIDVHLPTIMEGAAELIVPAPPQETGASVTADFTAALASLIGWPTEEIPTLLRQTAEAGVPTPDGEVRRSFGELVVAAFAELVKQPDRYPEAGAAFTIAMQKMALDLQRAMLPLLEGLPEAVDALSAARTRLPIASGRESLDLAGERIRLRPAELLISRYQATRFLDRGGLLAELLHWAAEPAPQRALGRLYPAPGGSGKTRLGIELIETLHAGGWRGTFLSHANLEGIATAELRDLFRADGAKGTCVVLDYAEGQIDRLRAVANAAAAEAGAGPPIRIVALARSAAGWWDAFSRERGPAAVFAPAPVDDVAGPLAPDERSSLYERARQDFVRNLARFGIPARPHAALSPDLRDDDYSRPLGVLVAAFLSASGRTIAGEPPFETLYQEERLHWRRIVGAMSDDAGAVADLARAATQITLVQGATEEGARTLIDGDRSVRTRAVHELLLDLRRLYGRTYLAPQPDGSSDRRIFIGPIEPDLLGEHGVMAVLGRDRDGLLLATMAVALAGEPLAPQGPREILTVLTRSTRPEHARAVVSVARASISALDRAADGMTSSQLIRLVEALPAYSTELLDLSATIARLVANLNTSSTDEALTKRGRSLEELGIRLSSLGRREEALAAHQEAVDIYRRLLPKSPDAYFSDLAKGLNNLGNRLSDLERQNEALVAMQEAVNIYRRLAAARPDTFLPYLATSLNNLGANLSELGQRKEALEIGQEAVDISRQLASTRPDAFLPHLARSLNNLGNRLSDLERQNEALVVSQEAVDIYRQLAASLPDAFLPYLATSLNNLDIRLSDVGREDEALAACQEAVDLRRQLAAEHPETFFPDLATSLNNLGNRLNKMGRPDEALVASYESISIRRQLAGSRPDTFLPRLARSLSVASSALSAANCHREAAEAAMEALQILAPFVERNPASFEKLARNISRDVARYTEVAGITTDATLLERVAQVLGPASTW